ncbi:Uncharacterized protein APZ42_025251 [Daphnia magna]|uniref:Uncharacterized protein n=1 Tax=Daphnia magna TaxID=35525 RepID=A0A164TBJ2_9CRUS|nr:Uncharacterized protein APZ42_025251 [Daphnia magna]
MIDRFLEEKSAGRVAVENLASDLDFPTNKELREVAIIRDVLKVFFQISTKLCAQKTVVASEATEIPADDISSDSYWNLHRISSTARMVMVHDMEERLFHRFQENETLALVAMVDPRMKCFAFADPSSAEKAVNLLKREARKIIFCSDDSQSPSTELVIEDDGIYTTLAKRAAEYKLMSSVIDKVDAEVVSELLQVSPHCTTRKKRTLYFNEFRSFRLVVTELRGSLKPSKVAMVTFVACNSQHNTNQSEVSKTVNTPKKEEPGNIFVPVPVLSIPENKSDPASFSLPQCLKCNVDFG